MKKIIVAAIAASLGANALAAWNTWSYNSAEVPIASYTLPNGSTLVRVQWEGYVVNNAGGNQYVVKIYDNGLPSSGPMYTYYLNTYSYAYTYNIYRSVPAGSYTAVLCAKSSQLQGSPFSNAYFVTNWCWISNT